MKHFDLSIPEPSDQVRWAIFELLENHNVDNYSFNFTTDEQEGYAATFEGFDPDYNKIAMPVMDSPPLEQESEPIGEVRVTEDKDGVNVQFSVSEKVGYLKTWGRGDTEYKEEAPDPTTDDGLMQMISDALRSLQPIANHPYDPRKRPQRFVLHEGYLYYWCSICQAPHAL